MAFLGFATFFFCSSEAVLWNYSYREARPQVLFFEKDSTEYSVWSRMAVGRRIVGAMLPYRNMAGGAQRQK